MNTTSTSIQKISAGCIALLIGMSCYAQTGNPTPTTKTTGTTKPTTVTTPATTNTTTGTTTTGSTTSTLPSNNGKDMKLVKQTLVYNSGKVYLNWVVPSNSPDCIYVIERSIDGNEFEPLGLKEGILSPLELLYSWVDAKPMEGVAHYRVKRVNNDGEVTALSSSNSVSTPAASPLIQDKTGRVAFVK